VCNNLLYPGLSLPSLTLYLAQNIWLAQCVECYKNEPYSHKISHLINLTQGKHLALIKHVVGEASIPTQFTLLLYDL